MVIDCERCEVRGLACGDCVVGVLLGMPGVARGALDGPADWPATDESGRRPSGASAVHLDAPEQRALAVLADDVIRALVAGEPQGRPVVVATSDKAVVASVCAQGAHSVPSRVLLQRLARS